MAKPNRNRSGNRPQSSANNEVKREQPRKDSRDRRVNFDNERLSKFDKKYGTNDPKWYNHSPMLTQAAASIPFFTTTGAPLDFGTDAVPGIMSIYWCPSVGGENGDPLNQAANSVYSYTVHANSRNYKYNAPDQMLLILAGANLFTAIGMGLRAYGVMRNYSELNSYTPEALVRAMGFDYTDLKNNLSDMWFDLNEMIDRSSQIWIPNTMPLIERWFWMTSNVYTDAESIKGQVYVYVPVQLYKYDETSSTTGGSLTAIQWISPNNATTYNTWAQYKQMIETMFSALLNSEDRGIIFGDMLKAYGADKIYSLKPIDSSYRLAAIYDKEVLSQIENASLVGEYPVSVTQNSDTLTLQENWNYYAPTVWDAARPTLYPKVWPDYRVFNFHQPASPTVDQVMVASRLMAAGSYVFTQSSEAIGTRPYAYGTEVCVSANIWFYRWVNGTRTLLNSPVPASAPNQPTVNSGVSLRTIGWWASFDWAPWIYVQNNMSDASDIKSVGKQTLTNILATLGDYDNYIILDADTLKKLHRAAIYSEFGIPQVTT